MPASFHQPLSSSHGLLLSLSLIFSSVLWLQAKAVELAIAAGLKQQLPKAIEGVFMDPDMNMRFDVTANVNTLVALIGVIAFWRGVWTLW